MPVEASEQRDIFISYEHSDRAKAKELAEFFQRAGRSVWWDHMISPGESWPEAIEKELTSSRIVIVLWSRRAVGSRWVRKEARWAEKRNVLIPALIEDTVPPFEFEHIHAADLTDWERSRGEFFVALAGRVDEWLRSPPAVNWDLGSSSAGAPDPEPRSIEQPSRPTPVSQIPFRDPPRRFRRLVFVLPILGIVTAALIAIRGLLFRALSAVPELVNLIPQQLNSWNDRSQWVFLMLALLTSAAIVRSVWGCANYVYVVESFWKLSDFDGKATVSGYLIMFLEGVGCALLLSTPFVWAFHKSGNVLVSRLAMFLFGLPLATVLLHWRSAGCSKLPHVFLVITVLGVPVGLTSNWLGQFMSYIQITSVASVADVICKRSRWLLLAIEVACVLLVPSTAWHLVEKEYPVSGSGYALGRAKSIGFALCAALLFQWFFNGVLASPGSAPTAAVALAAFAVLLNALIRELPYYG